MRLITHRDRIREVAARWYEQYQREINGVMEPVNARTVDQYNRLRALDPERATPADVAAIIGNTSWTDLHCTECKAEVPAVMQVGEEPDYESSTAWLCAGCLAKAAALLVPGGVAGGG